MSDEPQLDDDGFLSLTVDIVKKAQDTGDPRIIAMMDASIEQLQQRNMIPTLLLRYGGLLEEIDELQRQLDARENALPFLNRDAS